MPRPVRSSRLAWLLAAMLFAALVLPAGVFAADAPVAFCVPSAANTAVTTPNADGSCPSGKTKKSLASQTDLAAAEERVTKLESLLAGVTRATVGGQPTITFSGVNVRIVSGSGKTDGPVNGKGNLIVGYDEGAASVKRTGSHNIILGTSQAYASYGSLLAGLHNTSSAHSQLLAGYANGASGADSSITGGAYNKATGGYSTVTGGTHNTASANSAAVTGGTSNIANSNLSAITGGGCNLIGQGDPPYVAACLDTVDGEGILAAITGGLRNLATAAGATVTGGNEGTASGDVSSVSGGYEGTASGEYSSVSGGMFGSASGQTSSVSGGQNGTASGYTSAVSGGVGAAASGSYTSNLGGNQTDTGTGAYNTHWTAAP